MCALFTVDISLGYAVRLYFCTFKKNKEKRRLMIQLLVLW